MMLGSEDWSKIERKPNGVYIAEPYILTYFIGNTIPNAKSDLDSFATKYNLKIVSLNVKTQPNIYISGPNEIIYLIDHAQLVITDSFHAVFYHFYLNDRS